MEPTNSIYFEHTGKEMSASVKEDIATEPKMLLLSLDKESGIDKEIKFELIEGRWESPHWFKDQFPGTYQSVLKAIQVADYI